MGSRVARVRGKSGLEHGESLSAIREGILGGEFGGRGVLRRRRLAEFLQTIGAIVGDDWMLVRRRHAGFALLFGNGRVVAREDVERLAPESETHVCRG